MSSQRTQEQIREHYLVEKELAQRLRSASKMERRVLYTALYDELMERVPHHPRLQKTSSEKREERARQVHLQMGWLRPFLKSDSVFLEIGPGDCAVAHAVAQSVKQVYAVDVSSAVLDDVHPANCTFAISDGVNIPVPEGSVDIAFSYQLMEHLHPEDAEEQLTNIAKALKPDGMYLCITPSRLNGPHDVSKYFDEVPTGFHMREYSVGDLVKLFRRTGMSVSSVYLISRGRSLRVPVWLMLGYELAFGVLPHRARVRLGQVHPWKGLLQTMVVGAK